MKYNVSWNTEVKHSGDHVWNDSDNSHCFVTAKALDGSLSSKLEGLGTVWSKTFMSQSKLLTELLVTIFPFWRSKQRFHTGLHCNWASGKKKKKKAKYPSFFFYAFILGTVKTFPNSCSLWCEPCDLPSAVTYFFLKMTWRASVLFLPWK